LKAKVDLHLRSAFFDQLKNLLIVPILFSHKDPKRRPEDYFNYRIYSGDSRVAVNQDVPGLYLLFDDLIKLLKKVQKVIFSTVEEWIDDVFDADG